MIMPITSLYLGLHIPDGFLSFPVSLGTWVMSIALVAMALGRVQKDYSERAVPLMGVCAAFIFATVFMLNSPPTNPFSIFLPMSELSAWPVVKSPAEGKLS